MIIELALMLMDEVFEAEQRVKQYRLKLFAQVFLLTVADVLRPAHVYEHLLQEFRLLPLDKLFRRQNRCLSV